jgi:hypothetical protein
MAIGEQMHAELQTFEWADARMAVAGRSEQGNVAKITKSRAGVNRRLLATALVRELRGSLRKSTGQSLGATRRSRRRTASAVVPASASLWPSSRWESCEIGTGGRREDHLRIGGSRPQASSADFPKMASFPRGMGCSLLLIKVASESPSEALMSTVRSQETTVRSRNQKSGTRASNANAPEMASSLSGVSCWLVPTKSASEFLSERLMSTVRSPRNAVHSRNQKLGARAMNADVSATARLHGAVNRWQLPKTLSRALPARSRIPMLRKPRNADCRAWTSPTSRVRSANAPMIARSHAPTIVAMLTQTWRRGLLGTLPMPTITMLDAELSFGLFPRISAAGVPGALRIPATRLASSVNWRAAGHAVGRDFDANASQLATHGESDNFRGLAQMRENALRGASQIRTRIRKFAPRTLATAASTSADDQTSQWALRRVQPQSGLKVAAAPANEEPALRFQTGARELVVLGNVGRRAEICGNEGICARLHSARRLTERRNIIRRVARRNVAKHTHRADERRIARGESARSASVQVLGEVQESCGRASAATLADGPSGAPAGRCNSDSRVVFRTAARQGPRPRKKSPPLLLRATLIRERAAQSTEIAFQARPGRHPRVARATRSRKPCFAFCRTCAREHLRQPRIVLGSPAETRSRAVRIELASERFLSQAEWERCPALASTRESSGEPRINFGLNPLVENFLKLLAQIRREVQARQLNGFQRHLRTLCQVIERRAGAAHELPPVLLTPKEQEERKCARIVARTFRCAMVPA